jgi:glucan phosphoethanolaminetransferase (alkaline phosphatase superfamily)
MINDNVDMTMEERNNKPMTLKDWLIIYLIMLIPIVNIVLIIVWAFKKNVNRSKKTYCQASLIIGVIVGIAYILIFMPMLMRIINDMGVPI